MNESDRQTILDALRDLGALVDTMELPVGPELGLGQFPMAALHRCVELVRVAVLCVEHGYPDTVGVQVRAAVETWLTGSYILFGGGEALAQLEKESLRQRRALNDGVGAGADKLLAGLAGDLDEAVVRGTTVGLDERGRPKLAARFTVGQMASELAEMMKEIVEDPEDTVEMYHTLYRSYSTFDVHGLEPLKRRVNDDDVRRLFVQMPVPWAEPVASILVATAMTARLAQWMLRLIGRPEDPAIAISECLQQVGRTELAAALDAAPSEVRSALPRRFGGEYETAP